MPPPDPSMFNLDPAPKVITFDCYGTLVQWYEVLLREIAATLAAHGRDDAMHHDPRHLLRTGTPPDSREAAPPLQGHPAHRLRRGVPRTRPHSERGRDRAYRRITHDHGPAPRGPGCPAATARALQLAIFTNSDDDLIAPTVARIGVPFDYVITAEQARAYKPSRQLFEYAYRTMGVTADETVHVAMGMYWDMKARHELGLRGIWVNRRGETGNPDWLPYAEVSDLYGAAALLLPP